MRPPDWFFVLVFAANAALFGYAACRVARGFAPPHADVLRSPARYAACALLNLALAAAIVLAAVR